MSTMTPTSAFVVRRAAVHEGKRLFDIWWRSAAATHTFLSQQELEALAPSVRDLKLETLDTWVLCDDTSTTIGFMVLSGSSVAGLFIGPEWIGRGGGRFLLEFARTLRGRLRVDVNEQNPAAVQFYLACGFRIVGRSETDSDGRPYPLLHLEEPVTEAL